jgi:DNA uptake protein ComE-like DNA-binding protein
MKSPLLKTLLALAVLLVAAPSVRAQDPDAPPPARPLAKLPRAPRKNRFKKPAPASNVKLVDVNHATKKELLALPGMTEPLADKVIAGRPYLSKAWLASKDVLPMGVYQGIKERIVAVAPQPAKK